MEATDHRKFQVICADPPWSFNDKLTMSTTRRGSQSHYPVLGIDAIKQLRVSELADDPAILALWCPSSLLDEGIDIVRAWGFSFKQTVVWPKKRIGMGHLFRNQHELALIGTRGKYSSIVRNRGQSTLLPTESLRHSQKPESLQDRLELMLDGSKLELFARRYRSGWTCLGNELPETMGVDIRDTITWLLRRE